MKTNHLILLGVTLIYSTLFISCDKNDEYGDPAGTISVNILNVNNGKTFLGNSDVYIDNANNFSTNQCLIASLGKKNGLSSMPAPLLNNLADQVAVQPGDAYQIFKNGVLKRFPSGNYALRIDADYYNVLVVSNIVEEDVITGANVKYVLTDVPSYDLPEYNEHIGSLLMDTYLDELTIELPVSDFEYEADFTNSDYYQYTLEHEKKGNKIIVRQLQSPQTPESAKFGFYIRIKGSYSYVYGDFKYY